MENILKLYALEIGTSIFQNENNNISWRIILEGFGFEHLLKNYPRLIRSQKWGDEDYLDNIIEIIHDSLDENYENSIKMIYYIFKNFTELSEKEIKNIINIDNNFSNNISNENFFANVSKGSNLTDLSKDKNTIINVSQQDPLDKKFKKAFISYSTENKSIAHNIKTVLEDFGISGFLAHEDIEMSEEWQDRLLYELRNVDLVVAILSEDFNKSFFCIQEVGIALFNGAFIMPISIDGTKPEGFLKKIQSKKIHLDVTNISINLIKSSPEYMINNIIFTLESRNGYDNCARVINYLSNFFDKFKIYQINNFVNASINNNQIYEARRCKNYLKKFYNLHKDKIAPDLLEKFEKIL